MNTEDAKALLAAATTKRKCNDTIRRQDCKPCEEWWPVAVPAYRAIERLGFTPATLAVAIKLAEALKHVMAGHLHPARRRRSEGALADWEAL
jgi:hypothetical protein